LSADHLFDSSVTSIGCRKGTFVRGFMYDFIELFAPHLTRERVRNAMNSPNKEQLERLFAGLELPRL